MYFFYAGEPLVGALLRTHELVEGDDAQQSARPRRRKDLVSTRRTGFDRIVCGTQRSFVIR